MQKSDDVFLLTVSLLCGLPVLLALVVPWVLFTRPMFPVVERARRNAAAVGLVGGALTVVLAFLPIVVRIPGDHESAACGNALRLTWPESSLTDSETGRSTYDDCVLTRNVRRVGAITTLSGTALIMTLLVVRGRRRESAERTSGTPAT